MSSPGHQDNAPDPTTLADGGRDEVRCAEQAIDRALTGLDDLDALAVSEHVERFDAVHTALTDALSRAENLLSGSTDNGG